MNKSTIYIRHKLTDKLPPKTGSYTVILYDPKIKSYSFRSVFYKVEDGFRIKNGKDITAWLEKVEIDSNLLNIIYNENPPTTI